MMARDDGRAAVVVVVDVQRCVGLARRPNSTDMVTKIEQQWGECDRGMLPIELFGFLAAQYFCWLCSFYFYFQSLELRMENSLS